MLDELGELRPAQLRVRWSHHNFNDVKRLRSAEPRGAGARLCSPRTGWVDRVQPLWLTEGGYNLHPNQDDPRRARLRQARLIERNFRAHAARG